MSALAVPSVLSDLKLKNFVLSTLDEGRTLLVKMFTNELNSMTMSFFEEIHLLFKTIGKVGSIRCVVLIAHEKSKIFTAGLDLKEFGSLLGASDSEKDTARIALSKKDSILYMQETFSIIEKITQPVIIAVHNKCIGGGVDLIAAADIRICTKDTTFTIKEVDVGLAADLGTLQRLPRIMSNQSLINELALTCRPLTAVEALNNGLVSSIQENREELLKNALSLAKQISSRSPIAVAGTKHLLLTSRDLTVEQGLKYTATWNAAMLQTKDVESAVVASLSKQPPIFSNL